MYVFVKILQLPRLLLWISQPCPTKKKSDEKKREAIVGKFRGKIFFMFNNEENYEEKVNLCLMSVPISWNSGHSLIFFNVMTPWLKSRRATIKLKGHLKRDSKCYSQLEKVGQKWKSKRRWRIENRISLKSTTQPCLTGEIRIPPESAYSSFMRLSNYSGR